VNDKCLIQWRNRTFEKGEDFDHRWKDYAQMSEADAKSFIETKAPNSHFFEFRISKKEDNSNSSTL